MTVTEPSQAAEQPQRGEGPLPRREPLPQRYQQPSQQTGGAGPLPRRVPQSGPEAMAQRDAADPLAWREPQRDNGLFGEPAPSQSPEFFGGPGPGQNSDLLPRRYPVPPEAADRYAAPPQPQRGGEALPNGYAEPPAQRYAPALPQRGAPPLPQRGAPSLPQRGADGALPRRTERTRRSGRHRSPHRLTVPSDAPTLVLTVPGSSNPAADQLASEIAAAAQSSCQGADVQVAYLDGAEHRLGDVLADTSDRPYAALAVLVPLLACPNPRVDAALDRAVADASGDIVIAEHLGPHPLLAEAMHARLAEAGLARVGRARGLSIITSANGVLVLADRGEDAVRAAGVTAVLLAGRLAAPAAHASIDDQQGIANAIGRLHDAGASRVAIAPCIIGPETDPRELDAVAAATGAACAPPLGAHPTIAQLVAMRYGAALAGLRPADSAG